MSTIASPDPLYLITNLGADLCKGLVCSDGDEKKQTPEYSLHILVSGIGRLRCDCF